MVAEPVIPRSQFKDRQANAHYCSQAGTARLRVRSRTRPGNRAFYLAVALYHTVAVMSGLLQLPPDLEVFCQCFFMPLAKEFSFN